MPVKSHGESKTRLYNIWDNMKARCYRVSGRGYEHYGGRGIRICEEWLNNYEAFAKWARENGYRDDLSIDRIDVNGDYTPDNCRWVDVYVQANNRTDNVFLTVDGETKTMSEWSRITGINKKTIEERLKRGLSDEESVKTPPYNPRTANIGKRFNHLTVIKYVKSVDNQCYYLCKCDCGNKGVYRGNSVFAGHRKSCGCKKGTHNMSNTKLFGIWSTTKCKKSVCDLWKNDFMAFYKWANESGYKDGLFLHRIDENKPCSPENCEWLTRKQMTNRRKSNHFYEYNGESHTLTEWEEITGNNCGMMKERIRRGWDIGTALFAPKGYKYLERGRYDPENNSVR